MRRKRIRITINDEQIKEAECTGSQAFIMDQIYGMINLIGDYAPSGYLDSWTTPELCTVVFYIFSPKDILFKDFGTPVRKYHQNKPSILFRKYKEGL